MSAGIVDIQRQLIKKAKLGDTKAFSQLYAEIYKDLYRFALYMTKHTQDAEDAVSEAVEKSKKLLCSQVKVGSQVKQIVSGIKAHYTPEEMVGKKVMVLVNLKPAKLAGVLSEGMLLCAEDAEGNLALMTPEKAMPAGAEIC